MVGQTFFTDAGEYHRIKPLKKNELTVLSLFNQGLLQAGVAQRLHVSRPYVCQITKKLESLNLIKRKGKTYFYDLSSEAKSLLSGAGSLSDYTPIRAHHFKRKFAIYSQVGSPSLDKRAGFLKSWKMRGGLRHKFWFPGDANVPSVTLDVHPKTIVAYVDRGQQIIAHNEEEAKQLGWQAIYKAKETFIRQQASFGVQFEIDKVGVQIGSVHGALVLGEHDPILQEVLANKGQVGYKDWEGDKSKCKEGSGEIESKTEETWTRAGKDLRMLEKITEAIQPELFTELNRLSGISDSVNRVQAMLQGSVTTAQQNENILKFFSQIITEMQQIRLENADLKRQLTGGGYGGGGSPLSSASKGQQRLF